jgi:hypothetical protein
VRARGSSTRDSKDFDSFILGSFAGLAAIPFASGEPPMASIFSQRSLVEKKDKSNPKEGKQIGREIISWITDQISHPHLPNSSIHSTIENTRRVGRTTTKPFQNPITRESLAKHPLDSRATVEIKKALRFRHHGRSRKEHEEKEVP